MKIKKIIFLFWLFFLPIILPFDFCLPSLLIDTPVVTPHGMVPIQNLKKGDKVFTFDFNQSNPKEGIIEVTVKKITKHLANTVFLFYTSEGRTIGGSPQQLFFALKNTSQQDEVFEVDFAQAEYITTEYMFADYRMFIDQRVRLIPINRLEKIELSSTYPQYREKINGCPVKRVQISASVYALEVDGPHTFLISENPCYKEDGYPRVFLVHNGIPTLGLGVSLAFGSTPASISLAQASIEIGKLAITFGPAGLALGVVATGLGFLGYKIWGKREKKQSSLYIESAGSTAEVFQNTNKKYVTKDGAVKDSSSLKNASVANEPASASSICTIPATPQEPLRAIFPISKPDDSKCEFPMELQKPQVHTTPMIGLQNPHACINPIDHSVNKPIFCQNQNNRITIFDKNAQHIFRDKEGHFKEDTPENRKLLEDVANNPDNFLGPDQHGKDLYACLTKEGKQIWVEVRNGEIRNGGINDAVIQYNPLSGLSRLIRPSKVKI